MSVYWAKLNFNCGSNTKLQVLGYTVMDSHSDTEPITVEVLPLSKSNPDTTAPLQDSLRQIPVTLCTSYEVFDPAALDLQSFPSFSLLSELHWISLWHNHLILIWMDLEHCIRSGCNSDYVVSITEWRTMDPLEMKQMGKKFQMYR